MSTASESPATLAATQDSKAVPWSARVFAGIVTSLLRVAGQGVWISASAAGLGLTLVPVWAVFVMDYRESTTALVTTTMSGAVLLLANTGLFLLSTQILAKLTITMDKSRQAESEAMDKSRQAQLEAMAERAHQNDKQRTDTTDALTKSLTSGGAHDV